MQYVNEWVCLDFNKVYFPNMQQADLSLEAIICQPLLFVIRDKALNNTFTLPGLLQKPPYWFWWFVICTPAFCFHYSNQGGSCPVTSLLTQHESQSDVPGSLCFSPFFPELISYQSSLPAPSSHTDLGCSLNISSRFLPQCLCT